MTKFIEVHSKAVRSLINLTHVVGIRCHADGKCTIYFAFSVPGGDYITPDETYEQIKSKIFEGE